MEKPNEKSVYELLAMTASDSSIISDVPDIVFRADAQPRQKKRKRRLKRNQRSLSNHATCDDEDDLIFPSIEKSSKVCSLLKSSSILYCFGIGLVLSWVITLTILLLSFHTELNHLNSSLTQVVAGSQGVPDALQRCHSLSKQLEHNQTALLIKFNSLSTQIKNFSIQISELHITISKVEEKLNASPQVVDVPARLTELSNNVALFGSTIKDLTNTVNKIKEKSNAYDSVSNALKANITTLKESVDSISQSHVNNSANSILSERLIHTVDELKVNLTKVNETLDTKLKWVRTGQEKDHHSIEDIQGVNVNMSTRIASLQGDVNSLTAKLQMLLSDVVTLNASLHRDGRMSPTSPSSPQMSPLDFNSFDSNSPKQLLKEIKVTNRPSEETSAASGGVGKASHTAQQNK